MMRWRWHFLHSIINEREIGRSRGFGFGFGFGFVTFSNENAMREAIEDMKDQNFDGRNSTYFELWIRNFEILDLLAKFPPNSVKMKQPFCMQPWDSSPEIVKKLFKEMSLMVKYGLCPGTLKGELFRVLLEQGIHGLKVSELAKSHCSMCGSRSDSIFMVSGVIMQMK
ncbi:Hypothetical predicted protein [Prunus dulcis]|uniref:RRM domain-containing protein n=1 Tax=Prunus dulcis TaxID=3755 RepID=A0A5E4EZ58_PRUDU|nr:Hypothetical predicted protein [Prunus dulcis]